MSGTAFVRFGSGFKSPCGFDLHAADPKGFGHGIDRGDMPALCSSLRRAFKRAVQILVLADDVPIIGCSAGWSVDRKAVLREALRVFLRRLPG
jgi:hypothetical protein